MHMRILIGLSAIWFVIVAVTASAQDTATGRKLAVVVGNNEYRPNQGLNNLHQAVNDARRLSEALRNAGFTVIEMTHEVASQPGKAVLAPNADYIRDQLDGVIESPNLGVDDTVLISLHGHGVKFDFEVTVTKEGQTEKRVTPKFYFCPADSALAGTKTANQVTDRNHLIPLDELYSKLESCKAATKLLIVDACRNDPTRGEFRESLASVTRPKLPPPPGGIAAFFSCKENQLAVEDSDLKQGVFTHFLIQGLEGKADQPLEGKPADGVITLSELTTYVANNTHAYVLDKYKGARQSPDIKGEFDTNTPLVRVGKLSKKLVNSIGMEFVSIPGGTPVEYGNHERIAPFEISITKVTVGDFKRFVEATRFKTVAEMASAGQLNRNEIEAFYKQARVANWNLTSPPATTADFLGEGVEKPNGDLVRSTKFTWREVGWKQDDSHPVVNVTIYDVMKFCEWLTAKEMRTYRLPTYDEEIWIRQAHIVLPLVNDNANENQLDIDTTHRQMDREAKFHFAQWELAAKPAQVGYALLGTERKPTLATTPVRLGQPNGLGLFDLHQNGNEWNHSQGMTGAFAFEAGRGASPAVIKPEAKLGFRVVRELR